MGLEPVVEPLLGIKALHPPIPSFDVLAFTSANGVRAFAPLSARRDGPVWCVGARTAEAARAAGFGDVRSAGGDVETLGAAMIAGLAPGASVLHAGNADAVGDLAERLSRAGFAARFAATYQAIETTAPGPALAAHLSGGPALSAALVHSPAAGRVLARLAAGTMGALDIAAISLNAATAVGEVARRTEIANHPDEASLLAALGRLVGGSRVEP